MSQVDVGYSKIRVAGAGIGGAVAGQTLDITADRDALGAATGVFTMASGKTLSSTNGVLSVTAADV